MSLKVKFGPIFFFLGTDLDPFFLDLEPETFQQRHDMKLGFFELALKISQVSHIFIILRFGPELD